MGNYGDWQLSIYFAGLDGTKPEWPMTFADWERQAEATMTPEIWSYVAGGAGDEFTQRANVAAFQKWGLIQRVLAGADQRDLSVELFGRVFPTPLMFAPVGVIGLCAPGDDGELITARVAATTGVPMILSTLSEAPLEDVAAAMGDTPGWFQLYPPKNPELCESLVNRAEKAGYEAIVVTLDTLTLGWRPRDLTIASFPQLRGRELANYFSDPVFRAQLERPPEQDPEAATTQWALGFGNAALSWDDLDWLRSLTDLPMLLKGVCHPDDARRAIDAGIDGIYCSTHGGRQANGGLAALECLPAIVEASGDVPVIFDSGVRSGPDVIKALALGASAVAIGRPYAYAMAVGGQPAVEHLVRSLLAEIDLTMAIQGYREIASLTNDALRPLTAV